MKVEKVLGLSYHRSSTRYVPRPTSRRSNRGMSFRQFETQLVKRRGNAGRGS